MLHTTGIWVLQCGDGVTSSNVVAERHVSHGGVLTGEPPAESDCACTCRM
jgi:hypothetical protein